MVRLIKRYGSRKLYDTEESRYVSLDEIGTWVRAGQEVRIEVTPGLAQGEWTVVQSPDLQVGDQVVGEVASFVDEAGNNQGGPFGGPPPN